MTRERAVPPSGLDDKRDNRRSLHYTALRSGRQICLATTFPNPQTNWSPRPDPDFLPRIAGHSRVCCFRYGKQHEVRQRHQALQEIRGSVAQWRDLRFLRGATRRLSPGCDNSHSMRGSFVLLVALALPGVSGCGYHTLGSAAHLPDTVHTLAVPVFKNKTQSYHTEIAMTRAVIREFSDRTRLTITPEA